ncbi:MAG: hypothetical protein IJT21_04010 [Synergistaceae bacterium]|nr:hypothetical protein [Synergistaceae bacterium]
MKKFLCAFALIALIVSPSLARTAGTHINEPYYMIKTSIYESMPKYENEIIFLGDSLTDYIQFHEVFPDLRVINRGIAGDTTTGVLHRLGEIISRKPAKLFIEIGINDIVYNVAPVDIAANIRKIIERVKAGSPATKIYLETLLPVVNNGKFETRRPSNIINAVNELLPDIAKDLGCKLLDVHKFFAEDDNMPERYTVDGVHMNGAGILHWMKFLEPYVKE